MIFLHWRVEENFKVKIGGNIYINIPNIIVYGKEPLFKIYRSTSDGLLGIDFDIYEENGEKVATIRKGMIVDGNEDDYSIVEKLDHYTITEKKSGRVICDLKKKEQAGEVELDLSVKMYTKRGFLFEATPTETNIGGLSVSGSTFRNLAVGISIKPTKF